MKKITKAVIIKEIVKPHLDEIKSKGIYRVRPIFDYDYDDIVKWILNNRQELKSIRGIDDVRIVHGDWENSIFLLAKPCKEFDKLMIYIGRCKNCTQRGVSIKTDVYTDSVSGKRSLYDVESRCYLMHCPDMCKEILKFLRDNKASSSRVVIAPTKELYCPDRFNLNGEDLECEWDGMYYAGIDIIIYTPSGRIRAQRNFQIYKYIDYEKKIWTIC